MQSMIRRNDDVREANGKHLIRRVRNWLVTDAGLKGRRGKGRLGCVKGRDY